MSVCLIGRTSPDPAAAAALVIKGIKIPVRSCPDCTQIHYRLWSLREQRLLKTETSVVTVSGGKIGDTSRRIMIEEEAAR